MKISTGAWSPVFVLFWVVVCAFLVVSLFVFDTPSTLSFFLLSTFVWLSLFSVPVFGFWLSSLPVPGFGFSLSSFPVPGFGFSLSSFPEFYLTTVNIVSTVVWISTLCSPLLKVFKYSLVNTTFELPLTAREIFSIV